MGERQNSPPEIAAARIIAIRDAARKLSIETGGDPAECIFELLCAAILVIHEARPLAPPERIVADVAPHAVATVEAWFADELNRHRCRHE